MSTYDDTACDALHCAAIWLERHGAAPEAVAVVRMHPAASVGVWQTGHAAVGMLPEVDDACAELAEAAAPVVQALLDALPADAGQATVREALTAGARLELLLNPLEGTAALRLVSGTGPAILVGGVALSAPVH